MFTLLIVDDSELIRTRLLLLLSSIVGIGAVRTASKLSETRALLVSMQPDLLVLDPALSDGNAMHEIASLQRISPRTAIAILTNDASPYARQHCLAAGAGWFFDKSTELDALMAVLALWARHAVNAKPEGVIP
jgi:two-component system OmpR family response regulator